MNRYSLLTAILTLAGSHVFAQTTIDKEQAEKKKPETATTQDKPATVIKVVPAAKSKHAKPRKVSSAKPRNARPGGTRPARKPRPSSRPNRPGNGRN